MRRVVALLVLVLWVLAAAQVPQDVLSYPDVTPVARGDDTTLLFSDSPETPGRSGLLYRDTVRGEVRVLAYHANGLRGRARLVVLARNVSGQAVTLTTTRRGSAITPGPDPVIGQQTLLRYFASGPLAARRLAPGAPTLLFSTPALPRGAVASLMLDLRLSGPVRISVLMVAEGQPFTPGALDRLPALPRDRNHQRGTFRGANREMQVTLPPGTSRLTLGGQRDVPLRGTDALTGDPQTLLGNYGVVYSVRVGGTRGRQLLVSPRGGAYRGTLDVRDGARSTSLLIGQGRALSEYTLSPVLNRARGDLLELRFVPGNGSNLPVALVFSAAPSARGAAISPARGR